MNTDRELIGLRIRIVKGRDTAITATAMWSGLPPVLFRRYHAPRNCY